MSKGRTSIVIHDGIHKSALSNWVKGGDKL